MSAYRPLVLPLSVSPKRFRIALATAALCGLAIAAALGTPEAAAEEAKPAPQWQSILAIQLSDTYKCDRDKILFFREVPVGDTQSTEGRVRCLDGREYDFSRDRGHEKFTVRLCQPTVC